MGALVQMHQKPFLKKDDFSMAQNVLAVSVILLVNTIDGFIVKLTLQY